MGGISKRCLRKQNNNAIFAACSRLRHQRVKVDSISHCWRTPLRVAGKFFWCQHFTLFTLHCLAWFWGSFSKKKKEQKAFKEKKRTIRTSWIGRKRWTYDLMWFLNLVDSVLFMCFARWLWHDVLQLCFYAWVWVFCFSIQNDSFVIPFLQLLQIRVLLPGVMIIFISRSLFQ